MKKLDCNHMADTARRLYYLAAGVGGFANIVAKKNDRQATAFCIGQRWHEDCRVYARVVEDGSCLVEIRGIIAIYGTIDHVEKVLSLIPDDMKPYTNLQ